MKRPDVFSAVYAMSPCCVDFHHAVLDADVVEQLLALRTPNDLDRVLADISVGRGQGMDGFFVLANVALAAAWSPNFAARVGAHTTPNDLVAQTRAAGRPAAAVQIEDREVSDLPRTLNDDPPVAQPARVRTHVERHRVSRTYTRQWRGSACGILRAG